MSLVRSVGALDFDSLPPGQERPRAGEVVGHAGQSEPGSIGVVGPVIRPGDNRGREIGRRRFSASDPQRHPSATPRSRQTAHETGRFARRHGVLIQANSRGSLGTRDPCRHPRVRRSTGQSKAKRPRWRTPPITGLRDLQTQERRRALLQRTKTVAGPRHAIRQTRRCIPRSGSTSAGDRLATRLRDTA
ncbi:hypothetical protein BAURA63_03131 [Brevibacterium aurantiacum]|uniref:Uncharacterized protein n=1 Tax=Brevibacterium aurantiacum TaxID=273384 RepID=A0A2H1KAF5_BREAU|nr:hypothetical protein BAURA63_03131 [Brevibacterium aurantiacum]